MNFMLLWVDSSYGCGHTSNLSLVKKKTDLYCTIYASFSFISNHFYCGCDIDTEQSNHIVINTGFVVSAGLQGTAPHTENYRQQSINPGFKTAGVVLQQQTPPLSKNNRSAITDKVLWVT